MMERNETVSYSEITEGTTIVIRFSRVLYCATTNLLLIVKYLFLKNFN
jgi:hypothetical protein